ncbi:ATP synthase subunit delta [termite gut metagenome]|uniref:ATP synthase subunit delta n=1 Tax=termite gut metagenome TaxID=433724 RepID=A0A5J4SF35_9ZZZZ
MNTGIISTRYAKALIAYSRERGAEDKLYQEFKCLAKSFGDFPALQQTLLNPVLPEKDKERLIYTAADDKKAPSEEFAQFVRLVLKQRREAYLQYMCLTYLDLYRKLKHIGTGRLITAVPVDAKTKERITAGAKNRLHARMELETIVDPSILGGFILDINNYRMDASVLGMLKRVKQQFIDKNRRIV